MEVNFFAILLSLGILILKRFSTRICQFIQVVLNKSDSAGLRQYNAEMQELLKERSGISITDQFAEYALVDRKINKLNDKIQRQKADTRSKNMSKIM